jgi:hypothetical protein
MHTIDYIAIGFLVLCMLFAAMRALSLDSGRQGAWRSLWPRRNDRVRPIV